MTDHLHHPHPRRDRQALADLIRAQLAIQAVAAATGAPAAALASRRRLGREIHRARCMAMYLAHTEFGWPLHRVGAAFDRDRTTVGLACRWVEDLRDDPAVDRMLDRLGRGMGEILACEPAMGPGMAA